jgi:hypothetical protein
MWTFTTYIVYAFIERNNKKEELPIQISLKELYDFECEELKRKQELFLHSNIEELEDDVKFLSKIGILQYNFRSQNIFLNEENIELIEKIANGMKKDPMRKELPILDEYLKRIENAMKPI